MSSDDLLFLAVPPLIGAVIGLFTNWLAIKMLFRPLLEKRIFGVRVPFTPGILPRERKRLAQSLGDTVAIDLLDSKTVSERLRSPLFKDAVRKAAMSTGRKVLDAKPGDMLANIDPSMFQALRDAGLKILRGVFVSEPFRLALERGMDQAVSLVIDTPLADLVDPVFFPRIEEAADEPAVADGVSLALAVGIIGMLGKAAASGRNLSDLIAREAMESLVGNAVDAHYPEITAGIMKTLGDKDVVAMMEKTGAQIMRKAIDRMNAVQRFFIGLGQYDRAILESMPETIGDLHVSIRDTLSKPETRVAIVRRAKGVAAAISGRPLSAFVDFPDQAARDSAIAHLCEAVRGFVSAMGRESLAELVRTMVSGGTVGDILKVFPELKDKAGPALACWASRMLRRDGAEPSAGKHIASAFLGAFFREFSKTSSGVPLQETLAMDEETLHTVAGAAAGGLSELAAVESPAMLESMDIRSLVVDKIDSLDMIDVERMLLRIIDKELGAITAFGGVLGAIIGATQSALLLLR
jgi:hypothetical protein